MSTKVHRVRFYKPKPLAISCASLNKKRGQLALARADASIEVWDLSRTPYLVRSIPGNGIDDGSVEALGWVGVRLLSTGLSGALVEWDLAKLVPKTTVLLTGYAAWCLDINATETIAAVGTEQGYINLFSVENDEIVYKKLFDKQDGRIMCCKFDKTSSILVTGSTDTIRVWNVETGHVITRISVKRRKKEVVVWSIALLSDKTIVSGDSYGRLTFWDSTHGEQIESYTTQKADVLAVAVSDDEQNIYCSGIDPTITNFVRVPGKQKGQSQWMKNVQRHIHDHDVRALVAYGNTLISTGIDGYLTFSMFPPKWVMRIPPLSPAPRSSVSPQKKLLLLRYNNHLEVWKLGSYVTNLDGKLMITKVQSSGPQQINDQNGKEQDSTMTNGFAGSQAKKMLTVSENPVKLASIAAKHKKQIQCCEISPSGEFVIYATISDVRLLKLETDNEDDSTSISLSKVLISGLPGPCSRLAFADDSRTLLACCGGALYVLHADPEAGASVLYSVDIVKDKSEQPSILHLVVSKECKSGATYVAVADVHSCIQVFSNDNKKKRFMHHAALPRYECLPSAITVDASRESLIVVYTDHSILEYDLVAKTFCGFSNARLPKQWLSRSAPAETVCVHPTRGGLVLRDDNSLWVLDRDRKEQEEPESKRKPEGKKPVRFKVIPMKYLAGFHYVGADEAVAVEVLPESIVSQLPAPVQTNNWHGVHK